jgi:hypothetical protein
MSVRNHGWGWVEYATASEGFAQHLWALAWRDLNFAAIRPGWVIDLVGLVDTTPEGGNVRLTYDIHYDTATQAETDVMHDALMQHITGPEVNDTQDYTTE